MGKCANMKGVNNFLMSTNLFLQIPLKPIRQVGALSNHSNWKKRLAKGIERISKQGNKSKKLFLFVWSKSLLIPFNHNGSPVVLCGLLKRLRRKWCLIKWEARIAVYEFSRAQPSIENNDQITGQLGNYGLFWINYII